MFGVTRKTVLATLQAIHGFLSEESQKPLPSRQLSRAFYAVYVLALRNVGVDPHRPPQRPAEPE